MAILFDWYEDPKPSDKEQGEKTLHPRLKYNGSIGTDLLRQRIQERWLADGDGCHRRARRPFPHHGTRVGGREAGTSGRHRLLPPLPDQYGTGNDRHETKGDQSKTEIYPVSCRPDIEE